MGMLSFIIGFIIGWGFLSSFVSRILPFELGSICLQKIGPWCLFGFGLTGILTGLVVGFIFYILFK